jgi:hypothetical protein
MKKFQYAFTGAGVHLKVQFDAISRGIAEEYLTLSNQGHIVNVMLNSMRLQLRGGGRKIRAGEAGIFPPPIPQVRMPNRERIEPRWRP